MFIRRSLPWIVLCFAEGCLDTHEASLGEQKRTEADAPAPEPGEPGEGTGRPRLDAGAAAQRDASAESEDDPGPSDAATSLLCRFEPWHCRDSS